MAINWKTNREGFRSVRIKKIFINLFKYSHKWKLSFGHDKVTIFSSRVEYPNIKEAEEDFIYSEETISEFKKCLEILKKGAIYLHRIDYLVCDDDGEESFHERLKEDLTENGMLG